MLRKKGENEEMAHSTHVSRSMGEGNQSRSGTYIYQFDSEAGYYILVRKVLERIIILEENIIFLRTYFPVIKKKFRFLWSTNVPYQNRAFL